MSDSKASGGGIGFCGMLFLVFLVLKLTNAITWSWWWVTAPLWAPPVLIFSIIVLIVILCCKRIK